MLLVEEHQQIMQQRQATMTGIASIVLLVTVGSCALNIYVKAVMVVGTVGLAWISLALYNTLKSKTELEKVEDVKKPNCSVSFASNIKYISKRIQMSRKMFKNVR
jgi:threonine/homoserine/homoserine lactone efflux protein